MERSSVMFREDELSGILGVKRKEGYIEVICLCPHPKFGDSAGELRVFADGNLQITCKCPQHDSLGAAETIFSPAEFAKHAGKPWSVRKWKSQIFVTDTDGKRIALWRTALLKFHKEDFHRPLRGLTVHRDEFVRCSRCGKDRRFLLRSEKECRIYHCALANGDWKCSDMPSGQMNCGDEEERKSRKAVRGCPAVANCRGCTRCVCFGCGMCRFEDCGCRPCIDFNQNLDSSQDHR